MVMLCKLPIVVNLGQASDLITTCVTSLAASELKKVKSLMITPVSDPSFWVRSYPNARDRFRQFAQSAGGTTGFFRHPSAPIEGTQSFGIDTAWFGPRDAANVLMMISGTHGPELFAGSAMQQIWMQDFSHFRSPNTAVFLVHGVNSYGCAKNRRTTENNVDLNRNFIRFDSDHAGGALTQKVQNALSLGGSSGPYARRVLTLLLLLGLRHGLATVTNEITAGQYSRHDGVGFGGNAPEWSNTTLCDLWRDRLSQARRVAIIDWHTGIGGYGDPSFLCFEAPGSLGFARAVDWWGDAVAQSADHFDAGVRPSYNGLLIRAAQEIAQTTGAETTGAVIEFGTYPNKQMLRGLLLDRWLQHAPSTTSEAVKTKLENDLLRLFCPDDRQWQQRVLQAGRHIIHQTVEGLNNWDGATA
jgi:hypothetical protein